MNNAKLMVIQIVMICRIVVEPQAALWNSNIVAMMPYLELTIILLSNVYTDSRFDVSSFSWTFWFILGLHPRIQVNKLALLLIWIPGSQPGDDK